MQTLGSCGLEKTVHRINQQERGQEGEREKREKDENRRNPFCFHNRSQPL